MWQVGRVVSSGIFLLMSLDSQLEGSIGRVMDMRSYSLSALFIITLTSLMRGAQCAAGDAEQHLELGNKMLSAGQLSDALTHYHAAIEADPTNYKVYYRRATVYLALGKSKSALPDLDKVIELKPDFTAARLQRGNVKLKQGKLTDAQVDYEEVLQKEPGHAEAQLHLADIGPIREAVEDAQDFFEDGQYQEAIDILHKPVEVCPWDPSLRELRAECYIKQGDYFKAVNDIRPTTKLRSDNTAGYFKISTYLYAMGEAEESLVEIRECLKLDPDHKDCHPHYKKVKKLVKQMQSVHRFSGEQRWGECVDKAKQMIKTEGEVFHYVQRAREHICHCHSQSGAFQEAMDACNSVLEYDENNVHALCDRAEAYILNEMYEEAITDYKKAEEIAKDLNRVQEGLNKAQKLLKQSQKRDYYKILGVKRNAKKKEIKVAYRKLAVKYHPDKYDGDDKKAAEKKFIDIAAAKEVLLNPELRERFDNGEDPMDPEEQQGGHGGHPFFHQGFNPFGNDGFTFKFNFN